jgi:glycopeptide antibiotics resistance protein
MAEKNLRRFRLHWKSCALAAFIFAIEVVIATKGRNLGWVRGFLGDVLAVMFVYYCFKTVLRARPATLALAAFAVGCAIEFGQYVAKQANWVIPNPVLRIVFGAVPDWLDVLAYGCGAGLVLILDTFSSSKTELKNGD